MNVLIPCICMLVAQAPDLGRSSEDVAQLSEMLQDHQHARSQNQAALLLVESRSAEAGAVVRQGLRQTETPDVFLALTSAIRLRRDGRFTDELFAALAGDRPALRQEAAETLALLADAKIILRLQAVAEDTKADVAVRQTAVWTLGRCGHKSAAVVLLDLLSSEPRALRQAAVEALTSLTGQACGDDVTAWRAWWDGHKELTNEQWLEERLAFQASRTRRLEGELERAKSQVVRLHQQLYSRLPVADRLGHVQSLADHEDPAVRGLAVGWCLELLPAADTVGRHDLTELLLHFSRDSATDVQRAAVLALGNVVDPRAFARLQSLLRHGRASVRAAAARSLVQQTKVVQPGSPNGSRALQRQVVPALQKALEDPALEVVVEAAEDLGALGVPEAVPVLIDLLRHSSEQVRQTAAQALERVADASVLDDLLRELDDSAAGVRFSLVGALGHAAGDGRALAQPARARLLARLEVLLLRDPDPGVRSRAATVLGECAPPTLLPTLWKRVQAAEESRVQEKAWAAIVAIIARAANLDLLTTWDRTVADAKQGARRLQLLDTVLDAWKKGDDTKALVGPATEALVQAQLDEGKWVAAFPCVRGLLKQPGSDADIHKRLGWLLRVGELALKEKNRKEALNVVQEAQPFLARARDLAAAFEQLERQAKAPN
jgi:HEAT repeat protein